MDDYYKIRDRVRVFISYSHRDKRFVNSLARRLQEKDVNISIDSIEISPGDSLIGKIRNATDTSSVVLAVVSESSIESQWAARELDIAMNHEIERNTIRVIPLLKDKVVLPGFLLGKQYIDFTTQHKRTASFTKLLNVLNDYCIIAANERSRR